MKSRLILDTIRTIGKYFLIGAIGFSATGCIENLLNTEPYDQIASTNMWTSDYLTDLGIAGVYNVLRDGYSTGGSSGRQLYALDRFGIATQQDASNAPSYLNGTINSSDGMFKEIWKAQYTGIVRANDAIHNMPEVSPSSADKIARYVAEAKFLRAYYYFRLNQVFKGVPVYLEETLLDDIVKPRETEAYVWEVIIKDLTDAINEPNLPNKYAPGNSDYGHVTKGAAYALRGKVYLYTGKYDEAISDFKKVEECGYGLYSGDYKSLFKEANEQCEEMIFTIQYTGNVDYGSDTQFYCGTRSSYGSCWNTYVISPNIVDLYECADGSKFDWEDYIPGYLTLPLDAREVFFLRDTEGPGVAGYDADALKRIKEKVEGRLEELEKVVSTIRSYYLPSGNEARIKKAYENRDPRLAANVITPYSDYLGVMNSVDCTVTSRWPFVEMTEDINDLKSDTEAIFYYLHRKYVYEGANEVDNRVACPTDFPIIRYADVLLMRAEALIEGGGDLGEATALINEVRRRAGAAELNSTAATMVNGRDDLRERLRNERRFEFVNEGINYFDEFRWGTLKEKVFYDGNGIKKVWGSIRSPYIWKGDHMTNTWAIPLEEIQRNPNIEKNQGWD